MDISELRKLVVSHIADPASQTVVTGQILQFINSAASDAATGGWLIDIDNTDITLTPGDYEYPIPAGIYIIGNLRKDDGYSGGFDLGLILAHEWTIHIDDYDGPIIHFNQLFLSDDDLDGTLMIQGFKKPIETYIDNDEIVDKGIESFIRERAVAYAARYAGRSGSQWARQYEQLFHDAWATSEEMMKIRLALQVETVKEYQIERRVPGR